MQLYHAPLEEIGGYNYRSAQAECFPHADKYISPFVSPDQHSPMKRRDRRDILPENNPGVCLVPQVLAGSAEYFIRAAREVKAMGYTEVNLNLGCPSRTVVTKRKGSGLLADLDYLKRYLDEIYEALDMKISLKTRIGVSDPEEFYEIMELYNQYPVSELIIHPRVQTDMYKNTPRMEVFDWTLECAKMPVVYNGDLFTASDVATFMKTHPQVECIMLGRGVMANPCLFGEIRGEAKLTKEALIPYLNRLQERYAAVLYGEKDVLFKMKEHWFYLQDSFVSPEKYMKKIRKSQSLAEYRSAARTLIRELDLK